MKNTKKLPNWSNFFTIEDFFTKNFLRKTTRLSSKLVEASVAEKTPEQELEELKNKELELKEQIKQPDSLLRDMYSSDSPKKDVIVEWAGNLERQYELEVKLHRTPVIESVGAISSYIKAELRSLGVHQSTYSYVHEVLGYKYKNEKYDSSKIEDDESAVQQRLDSSKPIADFEKQNASLIETFEQQRDLLKSFISKAKSSKILSELNSMQLLEYEETNLRIQATQSFAFQVIDDRQSVPILAQLKLMNAVVASTNSSAAGMYVSQVKQYGANKKQEGDEFFNKISAMIFSAFPDKYRKLFLDTIKSIKKLKTMMQKIIEKQKLKQLPPKNLEDVMTSKQAMKIIFGAVKNVLPVFDHTEVRGHHDRDAAIMDGFYGITCPECGSFRVRERIHPDSHEWMCFCYHCEWWFESKTVSKCWNCHIPLFEEILAVILKIGTPITNEEGKPTGAMSSKCPRCEKELILPAKMFLRTKLRGR